MTSDNLKSSVPSIKALVTATLVALVVAGAILVAFVLPAEYGIDKLGTGRALGLTDLANATAAPAGAAAAPQASAVSIDAPTITGAYTPEKEKFQFDSREYTLAAGEGMELKYDMKKGAGLVYSWTTSAPVMFEFHGEPDVKPAGKEGTDYYESYELDDKVGKTESHGTFHAPTTGIHGWFWENKSDKPVTLKVTSAGYFDWIMQNRKNKHTALKPTDVDTLPSHPKLPDEVVK